MILLIVHSDDVYPIQVMIPLMMSDDRFDDDSDDRFDDDSDDDSD